MYPPPLEEKKLISTREAAELSGYNSDYLARLCRSGKINGTQIGRTWLVSQESLEAFVKEQGERKQELREQLSEVREKEYKTAQLSVPVRKVRTFGPFTGDISTEFLSNTFGTSSKVIRNFDTKIKSHTRIQQHGVAVLAALVVMLFGIYVAQAAPLATFADNAFTTSLAISDGLRTIAYNAFTTANTNGAHEVASASTASRAKFAFGTSVALAATSTASTTRSSTEKVSYVNVPATHPDFNLAFAEVAMPQFADAATNLARYEIGAILDPKQVATVVGYNEVQGYVHTGTVTYSTITSGMNSYANGIQNTGSGALTLGTAVRDGIINTPVAIASTLAHSEINLAVGWSDLSQNILRSYATGVYAYINTAPVVPAAMTRVALETGTVLGAAAASSPAAVVHGYQVGMTDWVTGTPAVATGIVKGEIAVIQGGFAGTNAVLSGEKDAVNTGANLAYAAFTGTQGVIAILPANTQASAATLKASADNAWLGVLGNSDLGLSLLVQNGPRNMLTMAESALSPAFSKGLTDTANLAAAVVPFHELSTAEQAALLTYETLHGFFSSTGAALAYLFGLTPEIAHAPSDAAPKVAVAHTSGTGSAVGATSATTTITHVTNSSGGSTVINHITYVTGNSAIAPAGVSQTYVDDAINALRNSLIATIMDQADAIVDPLSQSIAQNSAAIAEIEKYTNITIEKSIFDSGTITNSTFLAGTIATSTFTGGTIASSTFTGGSIDTNNITTNSLTVVGTTTFSGNLVAATTTVTGDLIVNGNSYVSGTSTTQNLIATNATTTNQFTTNFIAANASTTNFFGTNIFGTNASITNATTTNFFATLAQATTGIFANLQATYATITNLASTNFTTTNSIATNATSTNATSTNLYATNGVFGDILATIENIGTAIITNLTATNGTITNLATTNATTTNATTTNEFATNLNAQNATTTNLSATNSTFTNSTTTNLTATNGSVTNLIATNATIQQATTTSFYASVLQAANGFFTNITANLANIANIASTNIITTNLATTNATTTNATSTNEFATNLTATNSIFGNLIATIANFTGFTATNGTTTNATSTNQFATNGNFTNSTSTNFGATNASITNATITNASFTSATATSLVSSNATSTNAYATSATDGTLSVTGNSALNSVNFNTASGTSLTATNITGTTGSLAALNVSGTTTTGGLSIGTLNGFLKATAGAISTSLVNLTSDVTGILPVTNGGTGTSSFATNGVVYGNGTTNLLTTAQGGANTVLVANNGAPAFSSAITIGTSVTSPILNSTSQIELNGANINTAGTLSNVAYLNANNSFTGNTTLANATSTSEYTSTFGLGSNYFTSLLGAGLSNVGGVLTVSNTALAGNFYQQNGNAFGAAAKLGTTDNNSLTLITNGNPVETLLTNGNVGIGTTTPTNPLTMSAGTSAIPSISFGDTATGFFRGGVGSIGVSSNGVYTTFFNVNGVGTSAVINTGTAANASVAVPSTGTVITRNIADANTALTVYQQNSGSTGDILDIKNSAGVQDVFTQAGKLGIGTTTPTYALGVVGTIQATTALNIDAMTSGSANATINLTGYNSGVANNAQLFANSRGGLVFQPATSDPTITIGAVSPVDGNTLSVVGKEAIGSTFYTTSAPSNGLIVQGNVGIGTTTPNAPLSVYGTGAVATFGSSALTNQYLQIRTNSGGNAYVGIATNSYGTDNSELLIQSGATKGIGFAVNNDVYGGAPALYINSAGNVGIGTTTPTNPLTLPAGSLSVPALSFGDTGTGLYRNTANTLTFTSSGVSTFNLTNQGIGFAANTGINNSTNAQNAFVQPTVNGTLIFRNIADSNTALTVYQQNSGSTGDILDLKNSVGVAASFSQAGILSVPSFAATNASATSTVAGNFTIAGNFGLGGAYFNSLLGAGLTNVNGVLSAIGGTSTTSLATKFYQQGGNAFGTTATLGTTDANPLSLVTAGSAVETLLTNGYVGIGTTSPAAQFTVQSANNVVATFFSSGSNLSTTIGGNSIYFNRPNSASYLTQDGVGGSLIFQTSQVTSGDTNAVYILANGNVGINNGSAAYKLDVAGFINTDQYSGYKQAGNTILYASSTNNTTLVGMAGKQAAISPAVTGITAVGTGALNASGLTGTYNNAFGNAVLGVDTSGSGNSGFGSSALEQINTGSDNAAFGNAALRYATGSLNNVAVGYQAGQGVSGQTSSSYNVFIGQQAGYGNTTGSNNALTGYQSGYNLSTGGNNVANGYQALFSATSTNNEVAIGYQALYLDTANAIAQNVAIGNSALYNNTYGLNNTAVGSNALIGNTIGNGNSAIGKQTLASNNTGSGNNAFGEYALRYNTTGNFNVALGGDIGGNDSALLNNITGSFNVALGNGASNNNNSATSTVAIGYQAAYGINGLYNEQGGTVLGFKAGYTLQTGSDYNTLVGYESGLGITTGARNVLIGQSTISASTGQVTTGSNNIAIGNDVAVASPTASNQLDIGNEIYGTGLNGTGATVSTGFIGIGTSTPTNLLTLGAGTASVPSLSFGDTGTGFYRSASGNIGVTSAGVLIGQFQSNGLYIQNVNNLATQNNGQLSFINTGAVFSRNQADANTALTISQLNAGSTGDILDLKNNTGVVDSFSQSGALTLAGLTSSLLSTNSSGTIVATTIGSGLAYSSGTLSATGGVSTTSLASNFFQQGGNAFGAPAVLGTTDANPLSLIAGGTTAETILTNGYVGIGTTTPTNLLTLGAGSASQPALSFGDTGTGLYRPSASTIGFTTQGTLRLSIGVNTALTSGNFGIGTSSPQSSLSVAGNSYFTGGLGVGVVNSVAGSIQTTGNILAGGNVGIGTTTPATALDVNGTLQIEGSAGKLALDPYGVIADQSYETFDTRAAVGYNGTTGNVAVQGLGSAKGIEFDVNNGTFGQGTAGVFEGNSLTGITQAGSFGIGTTTPWANLSINASTSGTFGLFPEFVVASSTTTNFIVASNGYVGIGTTTPFSPLAVTGQASATNFYAYGTSATSTFAGGLNVGNNALNFDYSSGQVVANDLAVGGLSFDTDSGVVQFIDLPITASSTAGTVESYSESLGGNPVLTVFGTADGAGNILTPSVGIGTTTPTSTFAIQGNGTQNPFTIASSTGATQLTFTTAGFLGLGTTSPYAMLSVAGSAVINGGLTLPSINNGILYTTSSGAVATTTIGSGLAFNAGVLTATGSVSTTSLASNFFQQGGNAFGAPAVLGTTDANPLSLIAGGQTAETILTSGFVGIGTTTPTNYLTLPAGSASVPSLSFGDTGTGLYRGGSSSVTFEAAGVQAGGFNANGIYASSVYNPGGITNSLLSLGVGATISHNVADANTALTVYQQNSGSTGDILDLKNSAGVQDVFTQAGYLGIGTTSPSLPLSVVGQSVFSGLLSVTGSGNRFSIDSTGASTDQAYGSFAGRAFFGFNGTDSNAVVQGVGSKGIEFNVNSSTFGSGTAAVITSAGNFGIGTTTPTNALTVRTGADNIGISLQNPFTAGENVANLYSSGGAGILDLFETDGTTIGSRISGRQNVNSYFNVGGGNVGIGTTTPLQALTVSGANERALFGDTGSTAYVGFSGDNSITGGRGLIGYDAGTGNAAIQGVVGKGIEFNVNSGTFGSGQAMVITSAGNVGIGTTSPLDSLDTTGNIGLANSNPSIFTRGGNTNSQLNVDFPEDTTGNAILRLFRATNTTGGTSAFIIYKPDGTGTTIAAQFSANSANSWVANGSGSALFGVGTSTPLSRLAVGGNATIGADYNVTAPTNGLLVEGNVGLGTTTPVARLDIEGPNSTNNNNQGLVISSSNGTVAGPRFALYPLGNYSTGFQVLDTGGGIQFIDHSGNQIANFNDTNDYVGIGTTTPGSILSINNVANFTAATSTFYSAGGLNLTNGCYAVNGICVGAQATSSLATGFFQQGGNAFGTTATLGTTDANALSLITSGTARLTILSGGRVGIGTTNPGDPFDVAAASASAYTAANANVVASIVNSDVSTLTDNATLKFQVTGSGAQAGVAEIAAIQNGTSGSADLAFLNRNNGTTAESMRILANGNVGIGTSAPAYKLDVAGFINTDQYSGYKQAGNTILYASSTNNSTLVGIGAGTAAISSSTLLYELAFGQQALASASLSGTSNTALGYQSLFVNTSGQNNTAVSWRSLYSNTTGSFNDASGVYALGFNTTGSFNSAFGGQSALLNNTTGSSNSAFGYGAMSSNITGSNNTAMGYQALNFNGSATSSVAIGYQAGYGVNGQTASQYNVFIGQQAGYGNTTSSNNVLAGYASGFNLSTGGNNTASGYQTLKNATSTTDSVAIGYNALTGSSALDESGAQGSVAVGSNALAGVTSGSLNTAVGFRAMQSDTSGTQNAALGYTSLYQNVTGNSNAAFGAGALYANLTGSLNTAVGYQSLNSATSSSGEVAFGYHALFSDISNSLTPGNTAIGYNTLSSLTTGANAYNGTANTALGYQAGQSVTTGYENTLLGNTAGPSITTAGANTFVGYHTGYTTTTGSNNVAIGTLNSGIGSLYTNITGAGNTALGAGAEAFNQSATNTVAVGFQAAYGNSASYNSQGTVAIGAQAGYYLQTGSDFNTLLGYESGYGITTGARNILLGQSTINASQQQVTTGSNNIAIGNDVAVASPTASNQLDIGNLIYGTGLNGTGATVSTGDIGIGTTTPDAELTVSGTGEVADFGQGAGNQYIQIRPGTLGNGSGNGSGYFGLNTVLNGGSGGYVLQAGTNKSLQFGVNSDVFGSGAAMTIAQSGNVGIGTTTPNSTLTVEGTGANGIVLDHDLGTSANSERLFFTGSAFNSAIYQNSSNLLFNYQATPGSSSGNTAMAISSASGFVGIGTTTPAVALDIVGSENIEGLTMSLDPYGTSAVQSYLAVDSRAEFGYDGTTGNAAVQGIGAKGIEFNVNNNTFGSGTAAILTSAGNFGIGTTTPTNLLTLAAGTASIPALSFGDTGTGFYRPQASNIAFSSLGTQVTVFSNSGIFNNNYSALSGSSNSQLALTATGATLSRNVADANTALTVYQQNSGSTGDILDIKNSAGVQDVFTQAGYLGVGTTSPASQFTLDGANPIAGFYASSNGRAITISPGAGAIDSVGSALSFNRFSGNAVAIGFSSTSHFRIGQQADPGVFGAQALEYIGNTETATPNLILDSATGQTADIFDIRSASTTSGANILAVKASGYVGINNTNPVTGILSVGSNISALSGYGLSVSGSTTNGGSIALQNVSSAAYEGVNMYDPSGVLAGSFQYGNSSAPTLPNTFFLGNRETGPTDIVAGASANVIATFLNNGNVGIGTTSPQAQLNVDSTATGGTALYISNGSTGGHIFNLAASGSGNVTGGGYFSIQDVTTAARRLLIDPTGSVGIGGNIGAGFSGATLVATSGGFVGIGTTTPTNPLTLPAGTVSVPALSFGDTGTGFFRSGANAIAVAINGVGISTFTNAGIAFGNNNGIFYSLNSNAAFVNPSSTGTIISRNLADANTALTVYQQNSGSTGDILDLKNSAGVQDVFAQNGYLGLGTTSPSQLLSVAGGAYITGPVAVGTTTARTIPGLTTPALTDTGLLLCSGTQAVQTDGSGNFVCGYPVVGGTTSNGIWNSTGNGSSSGSITEATTTYQVGIGATTTPYAMLSLVSGSAGTTTLALVANPAQTADILDLYNGSAVLQDTINATGNVGIGAAANNTNLLTLGNGSATAPSLSFGDTGTGFYRSGSNIVSYAVSGTIIDSFAGGGIYGTNFNNISNQSNSQLSLASTGLIATRNIADANTALTVYQQNAGSTGDILDIKNSVGVQDVFTQAGRLGVGTTTPATLFSVAGAGYFTGAVGIGTNNTSGGLLNVAETSQTSSGGISVSSTNGTANLRLWNDGSNARISSLSSETGNILLNGGGTGYVGIGTTTATNPLTLPAGSQTVPSLSFGDTGTGFYRSNPGAISITSNGATVAAFGAGQTFFTNSISSLSGGNNANLSLATTGSTITRNVADANTALTIYQQNAGSTGDILDLKNSAGVQDVFTQSGSLGIGTTTPTNPLTISGTSAVGLQLYRTTATNSDIQYANSVGSMYAGLSPAGNFSVSSSNDLTNAPFNVSYGGFVGIGTTTPTNPLTLSAGSASIPSLSFGDTATGIYRSAANTIGFTVAGSNNVFVNSNGLSAANINSLSGPTYAQYSTGNASVGGVISRNIADAVTDLTVYQQNAGSTGDILDLKNSAGVIDDFTQSGTLGIGTTSPYARLSVVDTGTSNTYQGIASFLASNATQGVSIGYSGISKIGSNASGPLYIDAKGSTTAGTILLNTQGGNGGYVGIGTSTPTNPLTLPAGSTSVPSLSFGDTGTGFYRAAANAIQFAAAGGGIFNFTGAGIGFGGTTGIYNSTSASNSYIQPGANGTVISRNQADANTALTVTQANAGSTGDILDLKNSVGVKDVVNQAGYFGIGTTTPTNLLTLGAGTASVPALSFGDTGTGFYRANAGSVTFASAGTGIASLSATGLNINNISNPTSSSNGQLSFAITGTTLTRNVADANTALTVTQTNAGSTGDILDLKNSTGVVDSFSQSGALTLSGLTSSLLSTNSSGTVVATTIGTGLSYSGGVLSATGNIATSSLATNFFQQNGNAFGTSAVIGTTDANSLTFITGGTPAETILTNGNVGIGTTTPGALFSVGGNELIGGNSTITGNLTVGASNPNTYTNAPITLTANTNSYGQAVLQNLNSGSLASADFIVGADKMNNTSYYGDLGYNSSTYADPAYSGFAPNDFYLYSSDSNLDLGTASSTGPNSINFFAGGTTAANQIATINSTGLAIGTTTPVSTLTVGGSACISAGAAGSIACGTTPGNIYYVNANTGNYDVAENYVTTDPTVTAGTIVAADPNNAEGITTATPGSTILGVVSTAPGVTLGGADATNKSAIKKPVALSGRIPVKVSLEGGPIAIGDRIALSSTPGIGMKETQSGQTVGIALTSFSGGSSSTGTIDVFVQPQYSFAPGQLSLDGLTGNVQIGSANQSGTSAASDTNGTSSSTGGNLAVAGNVSTTNVSATGTVTAASVKTTANASFGGTVTSTGTITAPTFLASGTGATFAANYGSLAFGGANASSVLSADGTSVDVYKLATFTLNGVQALATQTSALQSQTATLASTTAAIQTNVTSLSSRVAALEAGAAAATASLNATSTTPDLLSTTTDALISGMSDLGVLMEKGIAQFNTLVVRDLVFSKDSDGTSAAGSGTILAGNTTVQITNSHMLASSQVSVTLTSPMTGNWYVTNKANGSFQVTMSAAQTADVTFDYLIIQTQGQLATSTPVTATTPGSFSVSSWLASLFGGSSTTSSTATTPTPNESGTGSSTGSNGNVIIPVPTGPAAPGAPTITLNGSPAISLNQGDVFIDPGAKAVDASSTDISSSIIEQGNVDTNTGGMYTLTYSVTDSEGRSSQVSRIVTVTANAGAAANNGDTGNGTGLTSAPTTSPSTSTSAPSTTSGSGSSTATAPSTTATTPSASTGTATAPATSGASTSSSVAPATTPAAASAPAATPAPAAPAADPSTSTGN